MTARRALGLAMIALPFVAYCVVLAGFVGWLALLKGLALIIVASVWFVGAIKLVTEG